MMCAARLAVDLGWIDSELVDRQYRLLSQLGLPCEPRETNQGQLDREAWLQGMYRDKKADHGKLHFILPTRMGQVTWARDVEPARALRALPQAG